MIRSSQYLMASIITGILFGCAGESNSDFVSAEQAMTRIPASISDTASLGEAYQTGQQRILPVRCIQGTEEATGNVIGSTVFSHDATFDDVIESLAGDLHVSGNFSSVRLEGQADVALKHAKTDHTETIHLSRSYLGGGTRLVPNSYSVTTAGKQFADENPQAIEEHCGQEFINEIRRGASLIATLKVEFFNDDDSHDLAGKLNVSTTSGIIGVDASARRVDSTITRRTKVSLVVNQFGGDPIELLGIVPSSVLACTMEAPEPCLDAFKKVFDYANGPFVDQIRSGKLNVLSYVSQAYRDVAGAEVLVPPGDPSMVDPRTTTYIQDIEAELRTVMADAERAFALLSLGDGRLTSEQRNTIESVRLRATHNADIYGTILRTCLSNLNTCRHSGELLLSELRPYNRDALNPQTCTVKTTYYIDSDGDGYGDTTTAWQSCNAAPLSATRGGDCCDKDARANPNAMYMLGVTQCGIEADDVSNEKYRDANCDGTTEWLGWGYTR